VTQGAADLAQIPLLDKPAEVSPETSAAVTGFITFVKQTLGDDVADVRASERLTDSAVCLVAPDHGPDRRLEKILAGAGRLEATQKPVLEVNPRHGVVTRLAAARESGAEPAFVEDAARLLFDEARILDGEPPVDPKAFAERLARVMAKGPG
jgi:molecular chaperone HtpG